MSTYAKRWVPPAIAVAAVGAVVAIPLVTGVGGSARAAEGQLERFTGCGALTDYAVNAALAEMDGHRRQWALPTATAADDTAGSELQAATPQAGADHSTTNVQYAGIDEPDIVKTDGRRIFAIAGDKLHAVDPSGGRPRLVGTLAFPQRFTPSDLLLAGDRLLVVGTTIVPLSEGPPAGTDAAPDIAPGTPTGMTVPSGRALSGPARTVIASVDVSSPEDMRIVDRLTTDASYASARMRDGTVRVVLTGPRPRYPLSYRSGLSGTVERALAIREMKDMDVASWLPSYRMEDGDGTATSDAVIAPCDQISRPVGPPAGTGTVTVLTIDPARGAKPVDQDTVMGASDEIMMSADNLYVTSHEAGTRSTATRIHVFDVSRPRTTDYRASGSVEGSLLNQFSMDEHDGILRVATTRMTGDVGLAGTAADSVDVATGSDSVVTTLRVQGRRLVEAGRVTGLGKGERIYAVRFMGDRGYVVTFRETDPLYTIDLSDPAAPRMTGELKINGYSAYLHPVGENRVLGIGQDATDTGRRLGSQVSLFDVSDAASPRRIAQWTAPGAHSGVEWDHRAFLWWEPTRTAVIPMVVSGRQGAEPAGSAVALRVTDSTIGDPRTLTQGPGSQERDSGIVRSLVIGETLYTLSDGGVVARDLKRLDDGEWLRLP